MAVEGVAIVDKAPGWTSHDVVARARRLLGLRRVGHAGTLDPDATGVLVLGVGPGTRLLRYVQDQVKEYEALIRFGVETSTLDASGDVTAVHDMDGLGLAAVRSAAQRFLGEIEQVPPMVSAVKVGGRRLHELARAGVEVDRPPRRVKVLRFDLEPTTDPLEWRASVECSSGTYVRTLAADLGRALGGGAHLRSLRRTRIGSYGLDRARPIDALEVLPLAVAVEGLPQVTVDPSCAARVQVGSRLDREIFEGIDGPGPVAVLDEVGRLLAVYREGGAGQTYRPEVVIAAPG